MRKIMLMLLVIAAAMNAMAVDYTAKVKVTLSSGSGYEQPMWLSESPSFGSSLDGSPLYESPSEGLPYIALYVINGSEKLQIARTSDFKNVKVGLKTNGSTSYTITSSEVEGSGVLNLYDMETGAVYALDGSSSYNFTATANSTINDRFVLNIDVDTEPLETCFTGTELNIIHNPYFGKIVVKDGGGSTIKSYDYGTSSIDFNEKTAKGYYYYTNGADYTVSFGGARAFIVTVKR